MSKAILIQQVYTGSPYSELLAFQFGRNLNYCKAHDMDYSVNYGNIVEQWKLEYGGWAKTALIWGALNKYEHVIWLDVDTLIADLSADLRDGCPAFGIGMTLHNPAHPVYNVGAMYVTNSEEVRAFIYEWMGWYPGPIGGWYEQAMINLLIQIPKFSNMVTPIDYKWNSTRAANIHVDNAVVEGFHGEGDYARRLQLMKEFLHNANIPA